MSDGSNLEQSARVTTEPVVTRLPDAGPDEMAQSAAGVSASPSKIEQMKRFITGSAPDPRPYHDQTMRPLSETNTVIPGHESHSSPAVPFDSDKADA